jgi:hypothetical protein
MGQKQTWRSESAMSALPQKADIDRSASDVRFVPEADIAPPIRRVGQHAIEMMRVS